MTGPRVIVLTAGLLALALTLDAQVEDRPEVLLQAAIKQELVEGDLKGAIEQFKKIAQNSSPEVAAQALLHMAACYDKLGQTEARTTYERVVREFPNQKNAVAEARAWLDAHGANTSQQAGLRVEQIWTGPDVDLGGQPSADGRYLPFVDWIAGTEIGNVAVRDLRTGDKRLLTDSTDDYALTPVSSPDGKQIAYAWGLGRGDCTIRLIGFDGTRMRVLTHDGPGNYTLLAAWSQDSKYIAAVRHNSVDRTAAIVLISTADGSIRQLKSTGWRSPDIGGFSPDGRFLVYSLENDPTAGGGGVFALATDGSRETPLVQGSANDRAPSWSPDGRRVFFLSDRTGTAGLWSIRIANGQPDGSPELMRPNIGNVNPMGFARDGSFYYGTNNLQTDAYTAEFDQETLTIAEPVPVTDRFVGNNRDPEFSPDGKSVAFLRRRANAEEFELVVRSSMTGEERTLTTLTHTYAARTLQWFPDSRSLLVHGKVNNRTTFRQVEIESGNARMLFEGPYEIWGTAALSPDGKALFYSIGEQGRTARLVKRHLETGQETELYRAPCDCVGYYGLTVSPDGSRLAFAVNVADKRALMIMPADGGTPREIYRSGYDYGFIFPQGAMTWAKDGRHLIVTAKCGPGEDHRLCAIPTEGGELKPLGLRMQRIPTRMLSPDGRRIAFTGATQKQELWVIRNLLSELAGAR